MKKMWQEAARKSVTVKEKSEERFRKGQKEKRDFYACAQVHTCDVIHERYAIKKSV